MSVKVARIDQSLLYSSTAKLETDKKSEEIHNKEGFLYMFLVVSLVLGLCFFSLPIIWMILKNKYMEGQRGIAHLGITRQETNSSQSNDIVLQEIDSSDYESIKDSEVNDPDMLEIINRLQLRDSKMVKTTTTPWTQNNLNISNSTAKHYSSNSNSTESPNHSYLDVIADTDYLNPYQIINMNECEEDEHSYCTTLDESRGGSNSIGNASLHLQKIGCPPGNTKYISLSQKTLVQKSALNNTRMSYSDGDINLYLKTRGEDAILRDHSANNNEIREGANSKWVIKANIAMDVRNADCAPRNCAYSNVVSPVYNITSKNAMSTLL